MNLDSDVQLCPLCGANLTRVDRFESDAFRDNTRFRCSNHGLLIVTVTALDDTDEVDGFPIEEPLMSSPFDSRLETRLRKIEFRLGLLEGPGPPTSSEQQASDSE